MYDVKGVSTTHCTNETAWTSCYVCSTA